VPHPEVDVIVVDGEAVDCDLVLENDTGASVYPVGCGLADFAEKHLQVTGIDRFITDGHLGKLARNLRLLGFDTAYRPHAEDRQLLDLMNAEHRALLTRDRRLLMHRVVRHGYYPRSQRAVDQTVEVLRRFNLGAAIRPFTRCIRCNSLLQPASKADVMADLEPLTKIYYEDFRRCPACQQVYWRGSHFDKLRARIEEICARLRV
jgi:uncharacterized protein with PIN domain